MKNILLTGAKGFMGRILLSNWENNYNVISLGRKNSDINVDLSLAKPLIKMNIDYVVHAAGKAHIVPKTIKEKEDFFNVNVKGTENLLLGLEIIKKNIKSFVFVSTVAVYGVDSGKNIDEKYLLNGKTPYALSKIEAEGLVSEWCNKNNIPLLILRLPLLAGNNPTGNLKAMINGIKNGYYFSINKGRAKRSVVLVEDIANLLKSSFCKKGIYNLTDDYNPTFRELEKTISTQLGKPIPYSIPFFLVKTVGRIGDLFSFFPVNSYKISKMICDLTFDCSKAKNELNWKPRNVAKFFKINLL